MTAAEPVISTIRRGRLVLAVADVPTAQARAALNVLEAALAKMPLRRPPGLPDGHLGEVFGRMIAGCRSTVDVHERNAAREDERRDRLEAHHDGTPYG